MATQNSVSRIIIQSDSQFVISAINRKIGAPKDIINSLEDIRYLLTCFSESRLKYCNRIINSDTGVLTKKAHF